MILDPAMVARVRRRLGDYSAHDVVTEREELVRRWREAHPEAAKEQSSFLKPLIQMEGWRQESPDHPKAIWYNDTYIVTFRQQDKDPVFGTNGGMIQLGISSHDGTARHDWRDFQAIKNQLAGPETEAFELYPAESRLLDPSNYYSLWCFPGLKRLKVGQQREREVYDAAAALAPQRAFPK